MKKIIKVGILFTLLISFIIRIVSVYTDIPSLQEQIIAMDRDGAGNIYMALGSSKKNYIIKISEEGKLVYIQTQSKNRSGEYTTIEDIKATKEGAYVLKTKENVKSQQIVQQVVFLKTKEMSSNEQEIVSWDKDTENHYTVLEVEEKNLQDDIELLGYNEETKEVIKSTFSCEIDTHKMNEKAKKNTYSYEGEGIYKLFKVGEKVGSVSKEGRLFIEKEGKLQNLLVQSFKEEGQLMTHADVDKAGNLYIGEQKSGNILRVDLETGNSTLVTRGNESIISGLNMMYKDIYKLDIEDTNCYSAIVKIGNSTQLVSFSEGKNSVLKEIEINFSELLKLTLNQLGTNLLIVALGILVFCIVRWIIQNIRVVLIKLIVCSIFISIIPFVGASLLISNSYIKDLEDAYIDNLLNVSAYFLGNKEAQNRELSHKEDILIRRLKVDKDKIYIEQDDYLPVGYNIDYFMSSKASSLYRQAVENKAVQEGKVLEVRGEKIVVVIPTIEENQVVGLLEVGMDTRALDENNKVFIRKLFWIIGSVIICIFIPLALLFRRILLPLKDIERILKAFTLDKGSEKIPYRSKDEFFSISKIFNTMIQELRKQIYDLSTLSETYLRFIPRNFFRLLGKKNIAEVSLGDAEEIKVMFNLTSIDYEILKGQGKKELMRKINAFFQIVNSISKEYEGILINNNRHLTELITLYEEGIRALEAATVTTDWLKEITEEQKHFITILDQTSFDFAIGGDEQRLFIMLMSEKVDRLFEISKMFYKSGCNLLVTQEALGNLGDITHYKYRYIGYTSYVKEEEIKKIHLYDFYQEGGNELNKLKEETHIIFEEALKCFYKKEFYKAKNLFSTVLRLNKEDEITRWYVFRCDELYKNQTEDDALDIVPYKGRK